MSGLDRIAQPMTPDGDAPPGNRFGWNGWLRFLGFQGQGINAPKRNWRLLNVACVSDETELVSYSPGIRGAGGGEQASVAAEFGAFELVGGENGARVQLALPFALRFRVVPPTAPLTLTGSTAIALNWFDPNRLGSSTLRRGTLTAAVEAALGTQFPTSVANQNFTPEIWVPPAQLLQVWRTTAAQVFSIIMLVTEPASATR